MNKKSIKNEDPSINFKLPKELRAHVVKEAALLNCTVSNYLRNHLADYYSGKLFEKEAIFDHRYDLIITEEFLQLVVWVFSKRKDDKCIATNKQLNRYIRTIKKLEGNLPNDLVVEFDKVLIDLLRVEREESAFRNFKFCGNRYTEPLFDYCKLESFILNEMNSYYSEKI